ncbi:hypothetical protein [Nocardioides panacisoli]
MELHESLYALGMSQGRELFNDADSLRGALDDYLDEDSASTGDINLLVDAVRLGAFQSMNTMLDSGATPDRAVAEAGARLARDRGSADVGGAQWALAVLGYAIGKVSDEQVRRYRTQHMSAPQPPQPGGAPTALPPQAGPAVPPVGQRPADSGPQQTAPVWPSSGGQGASGAPAPSPVGAGSGGVPSYGPPGGFGSSAPVPPGRKRSPLVGILVGLVALIVVVGVVVVVIAVNQGGGSGGSDDPSAGDSSSEGVDVSPDAINERYQSVSTDIATGAAITSCTAADTLAAGETEKIDCDTENGKLQLTTYQSEQGIDQSRTRVVDYKDEGQLSDPVDSGYFYLYDPSNAEDPSRKVAELYWDSKSGLQTALLTAGDGVTSDQLVNTWKATNPTVDEPTELYAPQLQAFATRFSIRRCERIPTLYGGELEEAECAHNGNHVWVAQFSSDHDFKTYRALAKKLAKQDGNIVDRYWWNTNDSSQTEQGKIYGYIDESGNGVLYADYASCLCYFQAYDNGEGDPNAISGQYFSSGES